ncbi:hypothetical protein CLV62_11922 [Dysgonomonas alginatilytica]|uniref:Uncharacterized protein n=1 Tax=Dysgonomonas alginatilytica TaxID=1605892 RepID=A0A2V3PNH1_9BACT|nr:DUF5606 domain-containing protein [Dysgonomonas alginatilytica]PXV62482.1 hypothetical protein CLV62_11922 [Dysgonomonas alginatilytica]
MLKTILSVSGKPGLFRLVSNAKNMVIVESLTDKRRLPIYARDKVVSLGDIAMYTDEGEVPLSEVLTKIQVKENGAQASVATNSKPDVLKKYFAEILPTYDRERVYDTDIKKLISWYNLLSAAGIAFLSEEEVATPEVAEEVPATVEVKEEAAQEEKPKRKPRAKKEDK